MRPGRREPEKRAIGLEVRGFYSIAELARAGNVPAYRLLRILRRDGVAFLRVGRSLYVPLTEIRQKIPPLWESSQNLAYKTRQPLRVDRQKVPSR